MKISRQECTQGFEYAGKLANGERVMGIVPGKAIASLVEGDEHLMWKVPDDWTLEEAATVPVVYATVREPSLWASGPWTHLTLQM